MKIIASLLAGLLWVLPAFAQEKAEPPQEEEPHQPIVGNPGRELGYLIQCMATETSLMHLRLQVAASIEALSAPDQPQKQLTLLADSYKMMAKDNAKTVKLITDTIKTAVMPQITANGHKPDEVMAKINQLLGDSIDDIATAISDPTNGLDQQIGVEQLLLEQSGNCETLAHKVMDHHTI